MQRRDARTRSYFAESSAPADRQWVTHDTLQSYADKGEYVVGNRLGGVILWAMQYDDTRGTRSPVGRRVQDTTGSPILRTLRAAMGLEPTASATGSTTTSVSASVTSSSS